MFPDFSRYLIRRAINGSKAFASVSEHKRD